MVDGESADGQRVVALWLDVGERGPTNWPQLHWSRLICQLYVSAKRSNDEDRIKSIEIRAVRRGKKGWNVGKHERLRSLTSRSTADAECSSSRGALTHQHQRRAHFRLLASGKVVFIRQATVRPDLPPPAFAPGYGVR